MKNGVQTLGPNIYSNDSTILEAQEICYPPSLTATESLALVQIRMGEKLILLSKW